MVPYCMQKDTYSFKKMWQLHSQNTCQHETQRYYGLLEYYITTKGDCPPKKNDTLDHNMTQKSTYSYMWQMSSIGCSNYDPEHWLISDDVYTSWQFTSFGGGGVLGGYNPTVDFRHKRPLFISDHKCHFSICESGQVFINHLNLRKS